MIQPIVAFDQLYIFPKINVKMIHPKKINHAEEIGKITEVVILI